MFLRVSMVWLAVETAKNMAVLNEWIITVLGVINSTFNYFLCKLKTLKEQGLKFCLKPNTKFFDLKRNQFPEDRLQTLKVS